MLLRRPQGQGRLGREDLCRRFDLFAEGLCDTLITESSKSVAAEIHHSQRWEHQIPKGRRRQDVSAFQVPIWPLALGTCAGSCTTSAPVRDVSQAVREFEPDTPLAVERGKEMLFEVVISLAQARLPTEIAAALADGRLTALSRPGGGVRGIAIGCALRRLVVRTLAKQFSEAFENEVCTFFSTHCRPEQARTAWDTCSGPPPTPSGEDACSEGRPSVRAPLRTQSPPVTTLGTTTLDSCWTATQAEGGEQEHPLMPLLFSSGVQGALEEVSASSQPGGATVRFL